MGSNPYIDNNLTVILLGCNYPKLLLVERCKIFLDCYISNIARKKTFFEKLLTITLLSENYRDLLFVEQCLINVYEVVGFDSTYRKKEVFRYILLIIARTKGVVF